LNSEKTERTNILKKTFYKNIVLSVIIPLVIFYIFKNLNMLLNGIILSGGWGIAVVVISLIKDHKVNFMALLTTVSLAIGLIGTIISNNPTYYLISPIITSIIWAVIYFVSLFFSKPFVQIIAENLTISPEKLQNIKAHHKIWVKLTIIWGIYQLALAVLLIILIKSISVAAYYTTTITIGNVLNILLIIFSIRYSRRYLKKTIVVSIDK